MDKQKLACSFLDQRVASPPSDEARLSNLSLQSLCLSNCAPGEDASPLQSKVTQGDSRSPNENIAEIPSESHVHVTT